MLLEIEKTVVEGAGAVGLAALMKHRERFAGRKVGLVLCGGNIEPLVLAEIIERGMVKSGRLARLRLDVRDVPGALADVADAARPARRQHRRGPAPARVHLALGRARADRGRRADARRRAHRGDPRGDARRRATAPSASADRSTGIAARCARRRRAARRRLCARIGVALPAARHPCDAERSSSPRLRCLASRARSWPPPARSASSFAHEEGSAVALALALAEGRTTAERLVRDCLARIEAIDRHGPRLHSVIELNPDAIAIAKALDGERKAGRVRGPLHGVPVLVKDNIATGDRMSTTAGSLALDGVRAPRDAHIVKRLRDGRRGDPRQDQPQRVGQHPLDAIGERLERARRPDPQSLCARPQPQRLELRHRRRRSRRAWRRSASAPRPTARSSRRRRSAAWSA